MGCAERRRSARARASRGAHRSVPSGRIALCLAGLLLSVLAGCPSRACAQPALDEAERALEEARFEVAARRLADAADGAGMSRDDVRRLLRLQAVVASALGRDADASRYLRGLASILGGRTPGPLPPQLRRQLERERDRMHAPVSVTIELVPEERELVARVTIRADPAELVRRTELSCNADGQEITRSDAAEVRLSLSRNVACTVRAVGPGGWVVDTAEARRTVGAVEGNGGGEVIWPYVLGAVGVAVLASVVVGIALEVSSESRVSGPMWRM